MRMFLFLTLLTGLVYPLAVTAVAPIFRTSAPVAHKIEGKGLFLPRPSAGDYAATPSGASNLGPTNAKLKEAIDTRRKAWMAGDPQHRPDVPEDLLTASGSGLDPDITPAAAHYQAERVAAELGVDPAQIHQLVDRHVQGPQWGLFGPPRVNVEALNAELPKK